MVTYLNRNRNAGYSIEKVMRPLICGTKDSEVLELPYLGASPITILKNLRWVWQRKKVNCIYHITGDVHYLSLVLPSKRTITTVHDLVSQNHSNYKFYKKILLRLLYVYPLKRNSYLVCISEKTKEEVLSFIDFPSDRIMVIPDPISNSFCQVKREFHSDCPVILHIGTKSNKNLHRTIEALSGLNVKLRIVGLLDPETEFKLKQYKISYTAVHNLTDEQVRKEYIDCDIVNFPSLYEGFGMPILEAQATGRVCITSDIEPMKSVAGDGAFLVNPEDVESIRAGYEKILKDPVLRNNLIERGLENVNKYSERNVIDAYHRIYEMTAQP